MHCASKAAYQINWTFSSSGTVQCECAIKAAYQIYWTFLHCAFSCGLVNVQAGRHIRYIELPSSPLLLLSNTATGSIFSSLFLEKQKLFSLYIWCMFLNVMIIQIYSTKEANFNNQTARSTVRQDMPEIPACWYCQNVIMMVVMIITIIMIIMVKMIMIMKRSVFIIMLCWWWWLWVLENWGNFAPNPSPSSSSQGPGRRAY